MTEQEAMLERVRDGMVACGWHWTQYAEPILAATGIPLPVITWMSTHPEAAAGLMAGTHVVMAREPTEMQEDAGADAYHEACEAAIKRVRERNDTHEAADRGRIAPEIAFPVDWLRPVYRAMLSASEKEQRP